MSKKMEPLPRIDKGVPVPVQGVWKRLYNTMKPGDSVLLAHNQATVFIQSWKNTKPGDGFKLIRRQQGPTHSRVWKVDE